MKTTTFYPPGCVHGAFRWRHVHKDCISDTANASQSAMIVLKNLSVSPTGCRLLKLTSTSDNSASKPLFSFKFFKRRHQGQCLRWRECSGNTPRLACPQLTQRLLRAFLLFSPLWQMMEGWQTRACRGVLRFPAPACLIRVFMLCVETQFSTSQIAAGLKIQQFQIAADLNWVHHKTADQITRE